MLRQFNWHVQTSETGKSQRPLSSYVRWCTFTYDSWMFMSSHRSGGSHNKPGQGIQYELSAHRDAIDAWQREPSSCQGSFVICPIHGWKEKSVSNNLSRLRAAKTDYAKLRTSKTEPQYMFKVFQTCSHQWHLDWSRLIQLKETTSLNFRVKCFEENHKDLQPIPIVRPQTLLTIDAIDQIRWT